jgi:hypothetical protein
MAEQKTLTDVVGSGVGKWVIDPKTGKERTPQEIIAAVTDAVLSEKNLARGVSLDPITGKPQTATDAETVRAALAQLASNAKFEGNRYLPAQQVSQALRGGGRGGSATSLANRPELWTLGKETVGTVIDRQNFGDVTSVKRFVVDPTKNQLTPEQLKQFNQIGVGGGMAIDPVTGFQVLIDQQGRYTLGEQPSGDVTGLDFSGYNSNQTSFSSDFIRFNADGTISGAGGAGDMSGTGSAGGAAGGAGGGVTTNVDVLKAALRGLGFSAGIIDSSTSFLTSLLREGLDYDNATEIFLNNKEYTLKSGSKITSPFYTEYGYLNEGLVIPKSANEIFNAVEGYKEVIDKYSLSKKYLEKDALKNYVKNNVTAKDLAERANIATLKSVNQDPAYVESLQKLGYIATAADLKDFFMDPKIGQEQLNLNRTTGAFAAEAIRRAQSGIQFNSERFKALASTMVEKGISEEGAATLAAQGFENIAAQLGTTTKLSGIYETNRAATAGQIQSELEKEEFSGLESERRKRLKEQEIRAFQGSAGTTAGSLRQTNVLGIL